MTAFRTICSCLVVVLLCERVVCEEFFHFLPREARRVIEGNVHIVSVSWSANTLLVNDEPEYTLSIDSNDESVASVVPHTRRAQSVRDPFGRVSNYSIDFSVRGIKLGVTSLRWMISSPQANYTGNYYVSVIREPSQAQIIFTILVTIIISINNINMGCLLDLDMIRKVLKAPVAPVIGFCCQFLFMPLGSYGIGLLFFPDKISWRLGLFTLGCSPGGTGSNFWTLLFHGDVDLSVTMTFVSTIAALGMMPLWMFTLGKSLLSEGNVSVPYVNLFFSLLALTIPLVIGLALQKYKPTWANFLRSILRPFTVCVMIITIVGGSYLSYYIFTLMDWKVVAAGLAVALGGYAFGAIAALVVGLKAPQVVAVSIETALQNPGVAFVLLQLSLGQPESDLAAVPIVAQLFMTGIPMWITYLIFIAVRKVLRVNRKRKHRPSVVIHENKLADITDL